MTTFLTLVQCAPIQDTTKDTYDPVVIAVQCIHGKSTTAISMIQNTNKN